MSFAPLADLLRALLILVCSAAGVIDIRYQRIPNWLTFSALVAAFAARFYLHGAAGLATAAKGMGLALAVYIPLWLLRGMGAGDVKLMSAVGAISGPGPWLLIFVASSLIGGVVALALAARHGRLGSTLHNTAFVAGELLQLRAPWRGRPDLDVQHQDALRMPHGAIIAVTVILLAATGLV